MHAEVEERSSSDELSLLLRLLPFFCFSCWIGNTVPASLHCAAISLIQLNRATARRKASAAEVQAYTNLREEKRKKGGRDAKEGEEKEKKKEIRFKCAEFLFYFSFLPLWIWLLLLDMLFICIWSATLKANHRYRHKPNIYIYIKKRSGWPGRLFCWQLWEET